jgi:glucosamine-6-phosphate deaminase
MTIGLGPILESREIWLLVTGSHKAGILEQVLTDPTDPGLPASFLREHQRVTVFADRAAIGVMSG